MKRRYFFVLVEVWPTTDHRRFRATVLVEDVREDLSKRDGLRSLPPWPPGLTSSASLSSVARSFRWSLIRPTPSQCYAERQAEQPEPRIRPLFGGLMADDFASLASPRGFEP